MEYYLIIARSITYAQRMSRVLERIGIRAQIFRAPVGLTDRGCSYALRVRTEHLAPALRALHEAGLNPIQVFLFQQGEYHELEPR
ncbi:DUF3343 domain-containing protein [Oscillibacter hominis]|uniref:DUF3343 domain-containing protein n=1 Tax=Oscillibacter hominis TaxID=2763056 RepID=A0A7G9B7S9_9FIRM|nr:DUF3343 domain-containing protein [Oscillibacter hominis]QNL45610.1 DUF3343 domain-containing protein [Oscillibacter hominis]